MDIVTHMVAGALIGEAFFRPRLGRSAPIVGALAAIVPDLDVIAGLISSDPLMAIKAHRSVTHSLIFVPVAAMAVALVATLVTKRRALAGWYLSVAAAGLLAHLFLDLATNYGMVILWPWSDRRWALEWLGFLDPYLLAIMVTTLLLVWRRLRRGRADPAVTRCDVTQPEGSAGSAAAEPVDVHGGLPWQGIALRGLAMSAIYVLAMGAFHNVALDRLGQELGHRGLSNQDIGRLSCAPVPLVPLAWNAFYTTDDGRQVHVGLIWILQRGTVPFDTVESDPTSPAIEAFRTSDQGRTWLGFARFPVITERPGPDGATIVTGWDARFQTWVPAFGQLKYHGSAIRAEVGSDGIIRNVRLGGEE